MRKLTIFSILLKLGKSSFQPIRHLVGKHDDDDEKPWRFYVKKYTEGTCDFDKTRTDCAECVNGACQCGIHNKHRCYDCKDENICSADNSELAPFKLWTKKKTKCLCEWKPQLGNNCACCFNGGEQCEFEDFKERCIAKDKSLRHFKDSREECASGKVELEPSFGNGGIHINENKQPMPLIATNHNNDHQEDHKYPITIHTYPTTSPAEPHGTGHSSSKELIQSIMNSMNEAFEGKTTSPVEPEIPLPPECAPKQQLYVPLFFWPSVDEDQTGVKKCRDSFWLSLRHGGPNVNIVVQTREAPVKINDLEIEAIQACVDAATSGQTQVLGYVDADFQQRNMNEILGDVKVWSDKFKSLDGLYLDPVGVQLKGADLHNLLTNISKFIRDNIYDHKVIVFSPQPDFYRY